MTEEEVFVKVREAICARFGFPPDGVLMQSDLYENLAFDSLDSLDMIIDIEKMVGRRIREEEIGDVKTVGDVVKAAHKLLVLQE